MTSFRVGIDAVSISRARKLSGHFIASYYHPDEAEKAQSIGNEQLRAEYLASRFAVKEAYCKACSKGIFDTTLREIQVVSSPSGQPSVVLHGRELERFNSAYPGGSIQVSITHEDPLAVAVVLISFGEVNVAN